MYTANGTDGKEKDAYSVFASFGAELEGGTGKAKVGLAQFFATGIAAQRLANNPAAVLALTVKSPEQGQADAAAVEAVAEAEASPEAIRANTAALIALERVRSESATSPECYSVENSPERTKAIIEKAKALAAANDDQPTDALINALDALHAATTDGQLSRETSFLGSGTGYIAAAKAEICK